MRLRYPKSDGTSNGGECCGLKLTVADRSTSGEYKFKVMSLLLGGADAQHLQVFSLRVAAAAAQTK